LTENESSRGDDKARKREQKDQEKRIKKHKEEEQRDAERRLKAEIEAAKRGQTVTEIEPAAPRPGPAGAEPRSKDGKASLMRKPNRLTFPSLWRTSTTEKTAPALRYPKTGSPVPASWKVIERYPIYSAFVYATIAEDPSGESRVYFIDEVPLSETETRIYNYLLSALEHELLVPRKSVDATKYFAQQARKLVKKYDIQVGRLQWDKILYFTERDVVGFGQLDGFMRDSNIEDISVDGVKKPVFVYHAKYERIPTNVSFDQPEAVSELIGRFAHISGRHVSTAYPIVQGTLPGGHRMMGTYMQEVSPHGGTLNIRRFRSDPITIIDMLNLKVLDHKMAAYIWLMMENRETAMVVGSTGAGKTTLLNALLTLARTNSKIITIEEVQEINLAHPNWTPFVARESFGATDEGPGSIGLFDLVKAAMRMRPDTIVVGEVRGEEAYVLFQAISTGHGGLCTLHADDAESAIQRLVSKPMDVPPAFISFLDLVFTVRRVTVPGPNGTATAGRRIISIDEVSGVENYVRMFTWDSNSDSHTAALWKHSVKVAKIAKELGVSVQEIATEIDRRGTVLKWMQHRGIRNFRETTPLFEAYLRNPSETYQRALTELQPPAEPAASAAGQA
jgi:flagellar protein FlaI